MVQLSFVEWNKFDSSLGALGCCQCANKCLTIAMHGRILLAEA
jgi:hypothetical protein